MVVAIEMVVPGARVAVAACEPFSMRYIARLAALVVGTVALCVAAFSLSASYVFTSEARKISKVDGIRTDNSADAFVLVTLIAFPLGLGLIGLAMRKISCCEHLAIDASGVLLLLVAACSSVHAYAFLSENVPSEDGSHVVPVAILLCVVAFVSPVVGVRLLWAGLPKTRWRDNIVLDVLGVVLLFVGLLPLRRFSWLIRVVSLLLSLILFWKGMRKAARSVNSVETADLAVERGEPSAQEPLVKLADGVSGEQAERTSWALPALAGTVL